MTRSLVRMVLGSALLSLTATSALALQSSATSTETKKFEVIAVYGNQLVVKLPEGTKELTVPNDFRFSVDGQMLSVQQLKPGMAGTATITTRTTSVPVTVTEVKNGQVVHALGTSIIVRTDEGIRQFTQGDVDKRGVKIMKEGKPAQISDFRPNDRLSATIITAMPPQVMTEQQVQATLARAAPASAPAAAAAPAPNTPSRSGSAATMAPSATSATLPKTASPLPLLGLMSLASLATGLGFTVRRRLATR